MQSLILKFSGSPLPGAYACLIKISFPFSLLLFLKFSLKSALIIFSTVPILVVYPFVQRYFVKGIMVGGVKG